MLAQICSHSLQLSKGSITAASRLLSSIDRPYAVDSRHRSEDEMHKYLDGLFCLSGQVAFVTGAGGGIGKAVCLALAK
jgi:FlaA1/EpsC-like NDP-sugar epimerase